MPVETEHTRRLRPKERKVYNDEGVDDDEIDGRHTFNLEEKIQNTCYNKTLIKEVKGSDFNIRYMQENGFEQPLVIKDKTGLGMRVPSENFSVNDVKQCVGSRRQLDVLDVTTQKALDMTMKEWVKYYENPNRERLLNVISLEFSHTRLENYVEQPEVVRQMDWVDRVWPWYYKECQTETTNILDKMKYPKVQKYCLMSVKGCYTDFHIDMGGTSVWYHVLRGKKIFWLIPPTELNLALYEEWTLSGKQGDVFFADKVEDCQRVVLEAGWTFFLPTGWIHGVYTPEDSLVFGGNFLHTYNAAMQLRVWDVETATHVPGKFRYPFFTELHWYVLERYVSRLMGIEHRTRSIEEIKLEREEEEFEGRRHLKFDLDYLVKSEGSTDRSEDGYSSPRSPIEVDHNYVSSPTWVANSAPGSPDPPMDYKALPPPKSDTSSDSQGHRTDPPTSGPAKRGRKKKGSVADSGSVTSGSSNSSKSLVDLIKPVSVKLENCLLQDKKKLLSESAMLAEKRPWQHLVHWEIEGLQTVLCWLQSLPLNKRCVPRDILDPDALLRDAKRMLAEHSDDDASLALTGEPILKWPTRKDISVYQAHKMKVRTYTSYFPKKTPKTPKGSSPKSPGSANRRRRVRCKTCEPCTREDCRECSFCFDMKKYGGPGRMKQSCFCRQCLAPELPHTSTCCLCGSDDRWKTEGKEDATTTLMECGLCWEIVHPKCLRDKFPELTNEGLINEDLPNSWECPKCCNSGQQALSNPRISKGLAKCRRTDSGRQDSLSSEISGESFKHMTDVEGEDGEPSPKKPKQEDTMETQQEVMSPVEATSDLVKVAPPNGPELSCGPEGGKPPGKRRGRKPKNPVPDAQNTVKEPPEKKVKTRDDSVSSEGSSKSSPGGGSKPCDPDTSPSQSPPRSASPCSGRQTSKGRQTGDLDLGAPQDTGGSRATSSQERSRSTREENRKEQVQQGAEEESKGQYHDEGQGEGRAPRPPDDPSPGTSSDSPIKVVSTKGVPYKHVVRPAPVPPPPKHLILEDNSQHALDRDAWMSVFRWLGEADLCRCLRVCKTWHRWCMSPQLWFSITLARHKLRQAHLVGLVRRQPKVLDLGWTNISRRQLEWLAPRLPHLKNLTLVGNAWGAVSALCSSACPLLTTLDLSWVQGLGDLCLRDLLSPPVDLRPGLDNSLSRLHRCTRLALAGTDISTASLEVILHNLPLLQHLDLSYCPRINNAGIAELGASSAPTRHTLLSLNLTACSKLTNKCFLALEKLEKLERVVLQACPSITTDACNAFCKRLTHQQGRPMAMLQEKLIEATQNKRIT